MGSSEKVDSYYNTVPSWHPLRRFFLAVRGSSPWNRLVSASYGMLRVLDYRRLVPRYRVVREVAEKVVELLRFGVQLDVLGPPRVGKSAGVTLGVVKRVVEYNVQNYTVVVVAINRRVAVNLYRYLVGWWKKIYTELRWRPDVNAMELAKGVKIVLYLGGKYSCLRGLEKHYMEHCLSCLLLAEQGSEGVFYRPPGLRRPPATAFSRYCGLRA